MPGDEYPDLESIWREHAPSGLRCCACLKPFSAHDALVRTFRVRKPGSQGLRSENYSKVIGTPKGGITFFDRHHRCLNDVHYVAISHVWDPEVARAQEEQGQPVRRGRVGERLFRSVFGIVDGLAASGHFDLEVWHDYVSVPQWNDGLKREILAAIPAIFQSASFTLAHMDDLTDEVIADFRSGTYPDERFEATVRICSAKWYSRVWCFMEFTRSKSFRVMTREYRIVDDSEYAFLRELYDVWNELARYWGNYYAAETMAMERRCRVPWMLGHVLRIRETETRSFGLAIASLCRRGCRSDRDFLYALSGVVGGHFTEPTSSYELAISEIANGCLQDGDYSPLLLRPSHVAQDFDGSESSLNLNEVTLFGLGACEQPASMSLSRVRDPGTSPTSTVWSLELDKIGPIEGLHPWQVPSGSIPDVARTFHIAVSVLGPDAERFVKTVGLRLFNLPDSEVSQILSDKARLRRLERILLDWYDDPTKGWEPDSRVGAAKELIAIMKLEKPYRRRQQSIGTMQFMQGHGMTLHGGNQCVVRIDCPICREIQLLRAALYEPFSRVRGATAYRIPGLKYEYSRASGVGILVENGEIVGRLIWASPVCEHRQMETVRVSLGEMPKRVVGSSSGLGQSASSP